MQHVVVTGFEPFDGELVNPSWEVVKQLDGREISGVRIVARQLPCVFGEALVVLNEAIDELNPIMVLAVGQAGGRTDITVERVAINIDDARIPDNKGRQPVDEVIIEGGPAAYFSTLPIKTVVNAIRDVGIPASVSQTAGTYVCNHVMYGLLHRLREQQEVKGGFIHIPYLPEQAAKHTAMPSMAAQTVLTALTVAIASTLQTKQDMKISGGATH